MPDSPFAVSAMLDWLGRMVGNHPCLWVKLGNAESKLLVLDEVPIEKPVYICGLARAGSTMLLETLASRPDVVTHRYRDFPFIFTPVWWNALLACTPGRNTSKRERAHGDRIQINPESPEAMEEMLWMAFFPQLHSGEPEVLNTTNPTFNAFYRDHIRKLLHIRKGSRYLSKGNYNVTRLAYLQNVFPDARFIIPVRAPAAHIASLMRQHQRFCEAGKHNPRVVRHMSLAGHFEFGLNRLPIHTGDGARYRDITEAWQNGNEVQGWALLWDAVYGFVHAQLEANPILKAQTLIVRYEDLCATPYDTLRDIFVHADLHVSDGELAALAGLIQAPDYPSPLTDGDKALIEEITARTAGLYGYNT